MKKIKKRIISGQYELTYSKDFSTIGYDNMKELLYDISYDNPLQAYSFYIYILAKEESGGIHLDICELIINGGSICDDKMTIAYWHFKQAQRMDSKELDRLEELNNFFNEYNQDFHNEKFVN